MALFTVSMARLVLSGATDTFPGILVLGAVFSKMSPSTFATSIKFCCAIVLGVTISLAFEATLHFPIEIDLYDAVGSVKNKGSSLL
jgi:hypothetical protein